MINNLLVILARLVIICLGQLVIEIILLKRTIIVMVGGLFLDQRVMHTMMRNVIRIIHVPKVGR